MNDRGTLRDLTTLPGPKTQLRELTSTRFFAAMAVLLGHFNEFLGSPSWLLKVAGGYGVSFFFVLSGFILTYRYWDDFAGGVERRTYRRYFAARIARIYPSYAMALVLITILYLLMNAVRPGMIAFPGNAFTSWLMNLLALQTFAPSIETQQMWNGPSWSISTEFGFYVACPVILAVIARRFGSLRGLLLLFALVLAAGIAMQSLTLYLVFSRGWSREYWVDVVASRNIFWLFPQFLTGVVAARLLYGGHLPWLKGMAARNALLVASLAIVAVLNAAPWVAEITAFITMRQYRLGLGYMIPFAGIILALGAGPTWVSPVLSRTFWVFLGDISYGIYIYHWIPWTILSHAQAHGWHLPLWLVTGVIAATILFSAGSYVWYERPARMFLRKGLAK